MGKQCPSELRHLGLGGGRVDRNKRTFPAITAKYTKLYLLCSMFAIV